MDESLAGILKLQAKVFAFGLATALLLEAGHDYLSVRTIVVCIVCCLSGTILVYKDEFKRTVS